MGSSKNLTRIVSQKSLWLFLWGIPSGSIFLQMSLIRSRFTGCRSPSDSARAHCLVVYEPDTRRFRILRRTHDRWREECEFWSGEANRWGWRECETEIERLRTDWLITIYRKRGQGDDGDGKRTATTKERPATMLSLPHTEGEKKGEDRMDEQFLDCAIITLQWNRARKGLLVLCGSLF